MTTTDININSAAYRLDQKPRPVACDCGRVATFRLWDATKSETRNVCAGCQTKGAK